MAKKNRKAKSYNRRLDAQTNKKSNKKSNNKANNKSNNPDNNLSKESGVSQSNANSHNRPYKDNKNKAINKIVNTINNKSDKSDSDRLNKPDANQSEVIDKSKTSDEPEVNDKPKASNELEVNDNPKASNELEVNDNPKASNESAINDKPKVSEKLKTNNEPNISHKPEKTDANKKRNGLASFALFVALLIIGVGVGILLEKNGDISQRLHQVNDKNTETVQPESPVLTVEVIRPQLAKVPINISADGTITAQSLANVSSKVNGLAIENVLVEEGQWVNKGDLLATFDTKALKQNAIQAEAGVRQAMANVKQAQANVVQADVNRAKAQADLNRVLPLLKIGAISQQQVDSYQVQLEQAKVSVESAKQGVESAKQAMVSAQAQSNNQQINYQDSRLVSPVAGVISQKHAQVGAVPQGPLFTIIEDGRLEWQAELNAEDVSQIRVGMPVAVRNLANNSTNNMIDNANNTSNANTTINSQFIRGKVRRIDPVANANHQISVYVALEPTKGVQSGMLLKGEFITGATPQIILPISAITSDDGYDYIMVVSDIKPIKDNQGKNKQGEEELTGRIQRMKVELGRQENNAVIIKTQLPANTTVVAQGGSFLTDGDLVRVVQVRKGA